MQSKYIIFTSFLTLAIIIIATTAIASILSSPSPSQIGLIPKTLNAKNISFKSKMGNSLSGWFVKGDSQHGGILLMHGVRSDRTEMIERAIFLNKKGYSILLFDFQAHGESQGEHITFGYLEARDAEAAFSYLEKQLQIKSIGVIGMSLGGASAILSNVSQRANAIVLEAVYPTIEEAIKNRIAMRIGKLGRLLSPLITLQIKPKLGFDPKVLSPIKSLVKAKSAIFIIAGSEDKHTTLAESKRMYKQAMHPKQFWVVKGAAHEDFYQHSPSIYRESILKFFKSYL